MRKRVRRLRLQRETLRLLENGVVREADLRMAMGAGGVTSIRNCESATACSNWCKPSDVVSDCDTTCCTLP